MATIVVNTEDKNTLLLWVMMIRRRGDVGVFTPTVQLSSVIAATDAYDAMMIEVGRDDTKWDFVMKTIEANKPCVIVISVWDSVVDAKVAELGLRKAQILLKPFSNQELDMAIAAAQA